MLGSYLGPDFVTEGRNLILHGKTGRGKTHLAVAIAYRAIQNGFDARFITAAALIDDLSHASERGRFREALALYTHPHVLVIDEVGYLTCGPDAANVLYHVVNDRYLRKRPMLFTTNKSLREWGRVLHDDDLARAIVDRALERGRLITLDGPSQRTRHLEIDPFEDPEPQAARISGTRRRHERPSEDGLWHTKWHTGSAPADSGTPRCLIDRQDRSACPPARDPTRRAACRGSG
jgi:hypothetical protein